MKNCEYFVKDGICKGVHWCAYTSDLWACPFNPELCGILEDNREITEDEIKYWENIAEQARLDHLNEVKSADSSLH